MFGFLLIELLHFPNNSGFPPILKVKQEKQRMDAVNKHNVKIEMDKDGDEIKLTEGISEGKAGVNIYRRRWDLTTKAPR